jgi:molybdopterin-guanine dinucleotide biosynthesis protein A
MGRDKARLRLGGLTFLTRIRRAAEELGLPVRVQRRDRVPGCGPLGGITTVLGQPGARAVLFLACDQPMVSAELLRWFVDRWRAHPAVALSLSTAGQLGFPLILPRSSAPTVAAVLARKQYSLQALARRCGARKVSLPRADLWQTANINSPEDLRVSRRVWRAQSAVSK